MYVFAHIGKRHLHCNDYRSFSIFDYWLLYELTTHSLTTVFFSFKCISSSVLITDKAPVSKGLMGALFITCTAINVPLLSHLRKYLVCQLPDAILTGEVGSHLLPLQKNLTDTIVVVYNRCGGFSQPKQRSRKPRISSAEPCWFTISGTDISPSFLTFFDNFFDFRLFDRRVFERRFGSHKFASHLLASSLISLVLETAAVMLIKSTQWSTYHNGYLPPGP